MDGWTTTEHLGIVTGEAILGANVFKDVLAGIRDVVDGRAAANERELKRARDIAFSEMEAEATTRGADAVVAGDLDYETIGSSMLMVSASGTAVRLTQL